MYFRVLLLLLLIETLNNTEHYPALDFTAKTLYEYVLGASQGEEILRCEEFDGLLIHSHALSYMTFCQ